MSNKKTGIMTEQKTTRQIRKELAILIKEKLKTCSTQKEKNIAVEESRREMNAKYGHGWRMRDLFEETTTSQKYQMPTIYDDHPDGEYWMD